MDGRTAVYAVGDQPIQESEFMKYEDLSSAIWKLAKSAGEDDRPDIKKMLINAAMTMLYPPAVQKAVANDCSEVVAKWAKRLREAMDAREADEEREWARDFEWPDDLS